MADKCPCGTGASYDTCCGKYHRGASPETAEQLMRSRYSAFVKGEIDYLRETLWPPYQKKFDSASYAQRSKESLWLGLEILESVNGQSSDSKGTVHFIAKSMVNGAIDSQEENSLFKKKAGRWYYVSPV